MKKIKVLMVAGSMNVGGIENQLMHVLRNADKDKFQIDFTSTMPDAYYRHEIESLGGRFIIIPEMNWKKPLPYIRKMYQIMKEGQYDIVHSHELFHSGITLTIALLAGVPCRFCHAHNWKDGDGSGKRRSVLRVLYNGVMRNLIDLVSTVQIGCSTWAGRFLYGKHMLKRSTYHLLYNSVDTEKFLDHYYDDESGEFCDDGWINVVNVARISKVKNQVLLVRLAAELRRRKKKIRILCAGSGDEADVEHIKSLIEKYKLEKYIQLLGVRSDIDTLLRKASAFILPSQYEGMPLVLIEAQASGLPCVIADTFSHEVDFGLNQIHWVPLKAEIAVWADAVEKAVDTERKDKSEVADAIEAKGFDSRIFARKLCQLYQAACHNMV